MQEKEVLTRYKIYHCRCALKQFLCLSALLSDDVEAGEKHGMRGKCNLLECRLCGVGRLS